MPGACRGRARWGSAVAVSALRLVRDAPEGTVAATRTAVLRLNLPAFPGHTGALSSAGGRKATSKGTASIEAGFACETGSGCRFSLSQRNHFACSASC